MSEKLDQRLVDLLGEIRVRPRRLKLRTDAGPEDLQVPILRSVWGKALHGLSKAAYDSVFHPQGHGQRPAYVLRPAPPDPEFAPAIEWISIGHAIEYDDELLRAWDIAGGMGLGAQREPFFVERRWGLLPNDEVEDAQAMWSLSTTSWPTDRDQGSTSVRLRFITPLSLMGDHKLIQEPTLVNIVAKACRRLGGFSPDRSEAWETASNSAVNRAKEITARPWTGQRFDLKRYSSAQQRDFQVPGVCGYLDLPEGAGEIWPILAAIQWIHLGKSTNVGLGQLQIERLTDSP